MGGGGGGPRGGGRTRGKGERLKWGELRVKLFLAFSVDAMRYCGCVCRVEKKGVNNVCVCVCVCVCERERERERERIFK